MTPLFCEICIEGKPDKNGLPFFLEDKKMKALLMLIVFLSIVSCPNSDVYASGRARPTIPISPKDANKFEGVLFYTCQGAQKWEFNGTAVCQYSKGDQIDLWIKPPKVQGEVVAKSFRREQVVEFDGDEWVKLKWGMDDYLDGNPIVVSVVGKGSGLQMAKLYPYVADGVHPKMEGHVKYWCYQDGKEVDSYGQARCQQPAGGRVDGFIIPPQEKGTGKYLIQTRGCVLESPAQSMGVFSAGQAIKLTVTKQEVGYCIVRSNLKYDSGEISEHEMYLDWFDVRYVPLPPPTLKLDDDGVYGCAPRDWAWFEMNGDRWGDCVLNGSCHDMDWLDGGWAYGIAWDKNGRVSWSTLRKE